MQNKRGRNRSFSLNNFLPENRRGQELSTTAIILIILGVLVLVILIVGFSLGWSRIAPWLSKDNVNQVVDACNSACVTKSVYDFCLRKREVIAEGDTYKDLTCNYIANYMQTDTTKNFGVEDCEGLSCNVVYVKDADLVTGRTLTNFCELKRTAKDLNYAGKYLLHYKDKVLESLSCAAPAA